MPDVEDTKDATANDDTESNTEYPRVQIYGYPGTGITVSHDSTIFTIGAFAPGTPIKDTMLEMAEKITALQAQVNVLNDKIEALANWIHKEE